MYDDFVLQPAHLTDCIDAMLYRLLYWEERITMYKDDSYLSEEVVINEIRQLRDEIRRLLATATY